MSSASGWGFGPAQGVAPSPAAPGPTTSGWDVVLANLATSGGTSPLISTGDSILGVVELTMDATTTVTLGGSTATVVQIGRVALSPTSPGGGLNSEHWGSGASASADNSLAVGDGSVADVTTTEDQLTALGRIATAVGDGSTAVGYSADALGAGSTTVGANSICAGTSSAAYGASANCAGDFSLAVGQNASCTAAGDNGTALGRAATVSALRGIAIGTSSNCADTQSIVIAASAVSTASGQFVVGSSSVSITNTYLGEGVVSTTPAAATTINASGGSGTDIHATDLILAGGRSTGDAVPADLLFQTTDVGVTGVVLQTLVTRLTLSQTTSTFTNQVSSDRFLIPEGGSTATPAANVVAMYSKADGLLYSQDDAGLETLLSGGLAAAASGFELIDATYQASGTSITITVPANTLTVDGEHLYIEALYEESGGLGSPDLSWDGASFIQSSSLPAGRRALVRGWIHRTAAAAQTTFSEFFEDDSTILGASGTDAATLSGTVDIVADIDPGDIVLSLKVWKVTL